MYSMLSLSLHVQVFDVNCRRLSPGVEHHSPTHLICEGSNLNQWWWFLTLQLVSQCLRFVFVSVCHTWEFDAPLSGLNPLLQVSPYLMHPMESNPFQYSFGRWDVLELGTDPACSHHRDEIPRRSRFCNCTFFFFSLFFSCILLDMVEGASIWSMKWLQEDAQRRWFHSSRVTLHLVRMSANCFLVSTYFIWIFGSKLILSNNQSRATLWVTGYLSHRRTSAFHNHLDHCFIVLKK